MSQEIDLRFVSKKDIQQAGISFLAPFEKDIVLAFNQKFTELERVRKTRTYEEIVHKAYFLVPGAEMVVKKVTWYFNQMYLDAINGRIH